MNNTNLFGDEIKPVKANDIQRPFERLVSPLTQTFNEDCMVVMARYPDKYFDLACVDVPYGIGMSNSNKRTKPDRPNSYTELYKDFRYHKTNWDDAKPSAEYFEELRRVSQNQIIWGANYLCEFMPSGYGWIFWNKKNGEDNCFSDGEFALQTFGVQSRYFECSVFDGLRGGKDRIHPTEKPVKLYDWLFKTYASEGQKILDTHAGSFASRIAAYKARLDYTGIELDETYFNKAEARFKIFVSQQTLF